jgi:hypothetical protein
MKAPILSFLELEGQGRGSIMGVPHSYPAKIMLPFLSEVMEAK